MNRKQNPRPSGHGIIQSREAILDFHSVVVFIFPACHPAGWSTTLSSTVNVYPDGVRPFHRKSTYIPQFIRGPCVVQIWSRKTPDPGVKDTLVLHRADTESFSEGRLFSKRGGMRIEALGMHILERLRPCTAYRCIYTCIKIHKYVYM